MKTCCRTSSVSSQVITMQKQHLHIPIRKIAQLYVHKMQDISTTRSEIGMFADVWQYSILLKKIKCENYAVHAYVPDNIQAWANKCQTAFVPCKHQAMTIFNISKSSYYFLMFNCIGTVKYHTINILIVTTLPTLNWPAMQTLWLEYIILKWIAHLSISSTVQVSEV